MLKFITEANIARFEALLAELPDEAKRLILGQILDRERATLRDIEEAEATAAGRRASRSDRPV